MVYTGFAKKGKGVVKTTHRSYKKHKKHLSMAYNFLTTFREKQPKNRKQKSSGSL
jgi:hypothetical protein